MTDLLLRALVFLAAAALGLLAAAGVVDGVEVSTSGFVVTVVVFALAQSVLSPVVMKLTDRYAKAFLGGVGLLSTFVALVVATLVTDGLRIRGVTAWVLATLVVWLVTALGTFLLPFVLLRARRDDEPPAGRRGERARGGRPGRRPRDG
ncbi:phage holin family protein [Cellulomonas xiejunii]|uniref:phage holin family protein n=1 Tax=Cellulomonas xiejunii TaxID=2968083 RepID=UPI001D0E5DD1|nr:phage holin family protein [Cellulomonas xiejunii]MCC2316032.1 phage holin family protein [Cellulomonas xiejunii]